MVTPQGHRLFSYRLTHSVLISSTATLEGLAPSRPRLPGVQFLFFFFSLYVFGEQAVNFRNFFLCCPSQRSARSQVPSLGGNPPGDWQSAVGWGDAGFEPGTAGQQPGALSLSYHASQVSNFWLDNSNSTLKSADY